MANEPVKSVHITNYFHKTSGGVSTSYYKLLEAAEEEKRFVSLIVPGEKDEIEKRGDFTKIYYVKARNSPIFDKRYRVIMPWQYMLSGSQVREALLAEMPQVIEIYDNYALTYIAGMIRKGFFKKIGRPMLVYYSGERLDTIISSFVSKSSAANWFARRLMGNWNMPQFDYFVTNSAWVADELFTASLNETNPRRSVRIFNKFWQFFKAAKVDFRDRVFVCPRDVDNDFFNPRRKTRENRKKLIEAFGFPENAFVLISSTRISPEKNIELLPEMMNILSLNTQTDFRLVVAGAGPREEWLRREAEKLPKGKIVLLGHLEKDVLADHYANADLFVHPNPREPFGNVGQEAMASGTPVLLPNKGGSLSYGTHENAWLTEATPENFAETAVQVTNDNEKTAARVSEGLKTAERNKKGTSSRRLFEIYDGAYAEFEANSSNFLFDRSAEVDAFSNFDYSQTVSGSAPKLLTEFRDIVSGS